MAKILMVIAQTGFRDEELAIPKGILSKHSILVASITRSKATGSKGMIVQPDLAIYEANPHFFDAIIIVGGPGSTALAENNDVLKLVKEANKSNKIVAAICAGPLILARAGVLEGRQATIFPDMRLINDMRKGGALYTKGRVVVDGKIITADGPDSSEEFGKMIASMLK